MLDQQEKQRGGQVEAEPERRLGDFNGGLLGYES